MPFTVVSNGTMTFILKNDNGALRTYELNVCEVSFEFIVLMNTTFRRI